MQKDRLFDLIAKDNINEVFDLLFKTVKSQGDSENYNFNLLVSLSARYNLIQREYRNGIIPTSEVHVGLNQIRAALIDLINKIDIKDKEPPKTEANTKTIENLIKNQNKIKILFLAANPLDNQPLRLDKEMREIETELVRAKHRDKFEFIKFSAVRIKDLQNGLLDHSPHFVHFSGHGNSDGIALLSNQTDNSQIVQSEHLANLFKLFSDDIACVFLNSCYSKIQGQLIKKHVPHVIGMNKSVPDNTAIEFASVFYKGIGAGREIGFSFELAKNSIDLNNISGSDIPEYL